MYMYNNIMYMYVPEIVNPIILAGPPLVPVHVTVEASMAVIRSVDSTTSSPLSIVLFVSVAVVVTLPSTVLVRTAPSIFAVDS